MKLKYSFSPYDLTAVPQSIFIGCCSDPRETRYGPTRRNEYLIHYVIDGQGVFNGHPVKKGQGFLITPGMAEHYYPDEQHPWSYLWIISKDPAMEYFFERHEADPETGVFTYRNVGVIEGIVNRLMTETNAMRFSYTQLLEFFLTIFNHCVSVTRRPQPSSERLYFDFSVEYISSTLSYPISVGELCQRLGVSQAYLYRVFKNNIGCSPKQYIMSCKLRRAQLLLRESALSVSEVATSVGFPDVLSFSRFFSDRMHCSPTQYRAGVEQVEKA